MGTAITQVQSSIIEQVIIKRDLSQLTPVERVNYYRAVCESVGLNPLTKPFDYINLKGKLTLYAKKDATDQLRKINGVSIMKLERDKIDGIYVVTAYATTGERQDSSTGAVNVDGLRGDELANAFMKAETKAKRRVTLSLCGLGWLDETEVETIPDAKRFIVSDNGDLGPQLTEYPTDHTADTTRITDRLPELTDNTKANGSSVKSASLKYQPFVTWCNEWVKSDARVAEYTKESGGANMYLILGKVAKLGFSEVTIENAEDVKAALSKSVETTA